MANESLHYLNDLTLDNRILPQVQMKLPSTLQIRLTLNKHENISHFKDIALPLLLLIDERDKPVFCFKCSLDHVDFSGKARKQVRRMDNIETHPPLDNIALADEIPEIKIESNTDDKSGSDKQSSVEKVTEPLPEPPRLEKRPKLVPNFSLNPVAFEQER